MNLEAPQILRHRIDLAQHPVFCFFLFPGRVLGHSRARQAMGMCWHVCSPSFSDVFDSSTFTSCSHIFAKCIRREYVEHTEATNPERDPCVMPFLRSSGRRNRRSFPSPSLAFRSPWSLLHLALPGCAHLFGGKDFVSSGHSSFLRCANPNLIGRRTPNFCSTGPLAPPRNRSLLTGTPRNTVNDVEAEFAFRPCKHSRKTRQNRTAENHGVW